MNGDSGFWTFFGSIWLIVGVGFVAASLATKLFANPADIDSPELLWVFLGVGLLMSLAGGYIVKRARAAARRARHLLSNGIPITATVTEIRQSAIKINRQPRWHVRYRYNYTSGQPLEGESGALSSEAIESLRSGDRIQIKVDPLRPEDSFFVGGA